jgi:hypothetical protein
VRNLVFAFHMFPTILPEMRNDANGGGGKGRGAEVAAGGGAGGRRHPRKSGGDADGGTGKDKEVLLPLPDEARLLPHGYLRRRLASDANGAFVSMERLGGLIITNDSAAAAAAAVEGRGPLLNRGEGDADADAEDADAAADERSENVTRRAASFDVRPQEHIDPAAVCKKQYPRSGCSDCLPTVYPVHKLNSADP